MTTTKTNSIKIALIAFIAVLAQGCTIYWSGMVDNKSGKNITVTGKGTDEATWKAALQNNFEIMKKR